jgi:hypothetical protein
MGKNLPELRGVLAALVCEKGVAGVEDGLEVEPEGMVEREDGLAACKPVLDEGVLLLFGELVCGRLGVR